MKGHGIGWLMGLLTLVAAGCSGSPVPQTDQVTEIRLTATRLPEDGVPWTKSRVATLKAPADIEEVVGWLNAIDWSQSGTDMTAITMPAPDGGFTIIDKSGATHNYGFYWDGKFVHTKVNRLIRGGDTTKLAQIVRRHCKE
jgi:hypothetical protein